ncbi:nuclease EXOG, mitochondrial-like [Saccostrea echinata]|uniref:nuclease EXOG, mitochondrial-like n=1 Tax=Saccostrea echinata TaxID=191078 RepID=UPI002A7F8B7F|nr:nuclease EXOG, mitochondrial-like [Saccostrea echinata]
MSYTRGFFAGTVATLFAVGVYQYAKSPSSIQHQYAQQVSEDLNEQIKRRILKYGVPNRGEEPRVFTNHVLSYDQSKKTPIWVAERITKDHIQGSANRKYSKFMPDSQIPSLFSADNSDFLGSGWSRGHMAPAGNNKHDQRGMDDTFYLSNIVPQNMDNNAGFWNRFEMYCRHLTKQFDSVQIISGPLVLPTETNERGQKLVVYPVIGKNEVAVPTHLYKVIVVETNGVPSAIGCFIVPNQPIENKYSLKEFQVSLEEIQKRTGVELFPNLDNTQLQSLCYVDSCALVRKQG